MIHNLDSYTQRLSFENYSGNELSGCHLRIIVEMHSAVVI